MKINELITDKEFPLKKGDNLIVVVPHHDDTVLGAGNFILSAQARNVLTTVTRTYVCCGRTNFFANYQENALSEEQIQRVTQARIEEDTLGCNELFKGCFNWRQGLLGEWDAPLRHYQGPVTAGGGAFGDFSTFRDEEKEVYERLISQFRWMMEQENTTILCLIANGKHVDHFNVREAMLHAAFLAGDNARAKLVLTEDEPYTSANPEKRLEEAIKLDLRTGNKLKAYKLPVVKGGHLKSRMHEIFNSHYRTQWSKDYDNNLLKSDSFIFYLLDSTVFKSMTTDISCKDGYCKLA